MKFSLIAATFTLASAVTAAPTLGSWTDWLNGGSNKQKCLTQDAANAVIGKFISVLQHTNVAAANATAQALFSNDYTEVSDSILSLEGQPVSPLFSRP